MSRHQVRIGAAALAAVMAAIYVAIGAGWLQVVDPATLKDSLLPFGLGAGSMFLVGAILLVATDRRPLWIAGALLQVAVAIMYVVVSQQRTPPFEAWGITLRVIQVPLFAALVYLALRPAPAGAAPEQIRPSSRP